MWQNFYMFPRSKKCLSLNFVDIALWVICIIILNYFLYPLLTDKFVAGWDLSPHFYLLTKMTEFLKNFHISGYDPNWFGGYSVFLFYGPFPYILMAIPYFLSLGAISLNFIFNLFLYLLPFFFLAATFYAARKWFGKKTSWFSLLFGLMYLLAGKEFAHFGIGISAEIYVGLFANLFAVSLMMLLLGVLGELKAKSFTKSFSLMVLGGLVWMMIILSHTLTAFFTMVLFIILIISYFRTLGGKILYIFCLGAILSLFWFIPFVQYLGFTSAAPIGILSYTSDPLFILFPYINEIVKNPSVLMIPGAVFLICSIVGIVSSVKTDKHFWPFAFLFVFILIPRDYLINVINLPIHYYRFMAHVFALNIVIAGFGMAVIYDWVSSFRRFKRCIFRSLILIVVCIFLLVSIAGFNIKKDYDFYQTDYPAYGSAKEMLSYIGALKEQGVLDGRVAAFSYYPFQIALGSPHFFATFLPLQFNVPVLPGLLAESSLSSQFVIPTMVKLTDGSMLRWGNVNILFDEGFNSLEMKDYLDELSLYNVEYLLLTKSDAEKLVSSMGADAGTSGGSGVSVGAGAVSSTEKESKVSLEFTAEDFSLVKLLYYKPMIEATTYKPFLFIDKGGVDFLTFAKEWYKTPDLFEYPVIYTEKSLGDISKEDFASVGGIILSCPDDTFISLEEYKYWTSLGKKVIFLNAKSSSSNMTDNAKVKFVTDFKVGNGIIDFKYNLLGFSVGDSLEIKTAKVLPSVLKDEEMTFTSYFPTLINYNYFPRWRSEDPTQTVFWVTPTQMFVFGRGETNLFYK